jgi:hypothetical protein
VEGWLVAYKGFRAARGLVMGAHEQRLGTMPSPLLNRRLKGEIVGIQSGRGGDNEVFLPGCSSES